MNERISYSLRRRLLLWLLIPLCIIGIFAVADSYQSAKRTANQVFDRVLAGSALAISERVFVNNKGELDVDIPYVALDMLTSSAQDRVFYRLEGPDGQFVTGYETMVLPKQTGTNRQRFTYADNVFQEAYIRVVLYNGVASTGERSLSYRIAVAETKNARNALTQEILVRSAARQSLIILVAVIIVWIGVTRSLIPLGKLEAAIGRRSPDDLRPILHKVPNEVRGLVDRINSFMGRLENALEALRHFTANASHQIRTPLTIVRTQLTLAQRAQQLTEIQETLKNCDHAVGDAERILSQLLLLARIDEASSKSISPYPINLTELAKSVTQANVIRAAKAGFDLGFEGEVSLQVYGEPILFKELLNNLIDNSIKHSRTGSYITVRVKKHFSKVLLEVEDNGQGIPEDMWNAILGRFVTVNTQGNNHSGLGLSIVSEIAALFDASINLNHGENSKGLLVQVNFPND